MIQLEGGIGQFKGLGIYTAEGCSSIQDPLQGLSQGVCRSDRQNIGSPAEGTQTDYNEWKPGAVGTVAEHTALELHDIDCEGVTVMNHTRILAHLVKG